MLQGQVTGGDIHDTAPLQHGPVGVQIESIEKFIDLSDFLSTLISADGGIYINCGFSTVITFRIIEINDGV